jgi:hypothetical protein
MTKRNSEIAGKFAKGAIMGYNKHMYIEGNTIFSYGHHFPIAKKWGKVYLMNSDGYSATTKRHKMLVFRDLSTNGETIIFLPNCDIQNAYRQREMNEKTIEKFKVKLSRVKTRQSYYESGIRNMIHQNKLIDEMIIPHLIAKEL